MRSTVSFVVLALIGAGAIYFMTQGDGGVSPATVEVNGDPQPSAGGAEPIEAAAEEQPERKKELPRKNRLYFPDGSYLPALNGAINAKAVVFRGRPFAPVIGKKKDSSGVEWYEHEDGSFSTTRKWYRKDLGRMESITQVAHPTDPKPLLVEDPGLVGPGGISPPKKGGGGASTGQTNQSGEKTGGK